MFDKLWDFLVRLGTQLIPIEIIRQYERGVRLRLGKLKGASMAPGLHWKIPFADNILTSIVTMDTLDIGQINITTTDNKTITVGAVLEFEVTDIVKFIIDTNEARSNIHDICRGTIADYLTDITYDECKEKKTIRTIKRLLEKKLDYTGITISTLTFTDMAISRVFKLFGTPGNTIMPQ